MDNRRNRTAMWFSIQRDPHPRSGRDSASDDSKTVKNSAPYGSPNVPIDQVPEPNVDPTGHTRLRNRPERVGFVPLRRDCGRSGHEISKRNPPTETSFCMTSELPLVSCVQPRTWPSRITPGNSWCSVALT
jgi:hypothetical protein